MNIKFADRLVALRKAHGLSQEEIASRIGVSRQAVSKWERAEASPDTYNLVMLSNVYGITLDELINGEVFGHVADKAERGGDDASAAEPLDSNDIRDGVVVTSPSGTVVLGGGSFFYSDNGRKKVIVDRSGITIRQGSSTRHASWAKLKARFNGTVEVKDGDCYTVNSDGRQERVSWSDIWEEGDFIEPDDDGDAASGDDSCHVHIDVELD
ncbi:MAG: helix-turn-helix transcriptional regulator, partial [Clostridia bacterium]|nr:helix-turn-helix transcriptional regulator [Clostridia bacterium]